LHNPGCKANNNLRINIQIDIKNDIKSNLVK
jgi:hypothetical protein